MPKLLPAERRKNIFSYIQQNDFVSINELCQKFSISTATVHRDLIDLQREREIQKIRGGATNLDNQIFERSFSLRVNLLSEQKKKICDYALRFVKDHSTILFDNSTTVLPLINKLIGFSNLTVVTYFEEIIQELSRQSNNINVISTGGQVNKEHHTLFGPITEQSLSSIKVQTAFISSVAVNLNIGIMHILEDECRRKQLIINAAEETNLLVDHTKFEKTSIHIIAPLSRVKRIITSKGISSAVAKEILDRGIELHIVD